MLKESSKVKELRSIRVKLLKESNDFKDELLIKIWKDLNLDFIVRYNDLYSIKGGECRRLKGYISNLNDDVIGSLSNKNKLIRENEKFNKLKDYLNSDVKLRSFLIDLCGSIGDDYSVFVDRSCFDE